MAVALVGMLASSATADVVTERSASILVFPKVIADGTRDTVIQISNTSNSMVHAHCFYVNGVQDCTEVDFDIWLTKQQPTHWVVSEGRLVDPTDVPCNSSKADCNGAGLDPGRVPPVVEDFQGELKCVEVDSSGAPLSGNHLKGEATLVTKNVCQNPDTNGQGTCSVSGDQCDFTDPTSCSNLCDKKSGACQVTGGNCSTDADCVDIIDVAKYNGLGVLGLETNDGDGVLCLGGDSTDQCPSGAEYNGCPQTWIMNHLADGAEDPVAGSGSSVDTDVTIVPCTENFETQEQTSVTVQFAITNEYEQTFSASTTVTCWAELGLGSINEVFTRSFVGTDFLQTRMRPSSGTASGFLAVGDELHTAKSGETAAAAANLHVEGERPGPDVITIPGDQLPPLP